MTRPPIRPRIEAETAPARRLEIAPETRPDTAPGALAAGPTPATDPADPRWGMPVLVLSGFGVLALGLAVYGALFALVGTVFRRPLLAGLVFAFGWEQVAMLMPGYVRRFTIVYYLQGMVPHTIPSDGIASLLTTVFSDSPSITVCLLTLTVILAASLLLASREVERREYVLGQ